MPSSAKQQGEITNSALSGEREPRSLILKFQIYRSIPDLVLREF